MRTATCLLVFGLLAALSGRAEATILDIGTYQLHNHPDGNARPPLYGLRLDELYNDKSWLNEVFTFDFDHPDAAMYLSFDGSDIEIWGVAYGGRDTGSTYDGVYDGLWEIHFTYENVGKVYNDDDLIVYEPDFRNRGTIKRLANGDMVTLFDYSGSNNFTFRLGDEKDDKGHRGFDGKSGWGWLKYESLGPGTRIGGHHRHYGKGDWLFTIDCEPIPEPATAALCLMGLPALIARRRGRRA